MKAFSLIHAFLFSKTYDALWILQLQLSLMRFTYSSCDTLITGHSIVGFAMYYFTYDPWIGKLLYLEDFFVMSDYRGTVEFRRVALKRNQGLQSVLQVTF